MKRVRLTLPPKRGRPHTYKPEFARMAEAHCKLGATDADLADLFGVSTVAIGNWMTRYPDFGTAVRHGKSEVFDPKVERSLAQRALGYSVDIEEVKVLADGEVVRYPLRKHFPPDTTACIFWLKNRNPKQWRDVQDHRHSGKLELDKLTKQELLEQIRADALALGIGLPAAIEPARASNGKTKH